MEPTDRIESEEAHQFTWNCLLSGRCRSHFMMLSFFNLYTKYCNWTRIIGMAPDENRVHHSLVSTGGNNCLSWSHFRGSLSLCCYLSCSCFSAHGLVPMCSVNVSNLNVYHVERWRWWMCNHQEWLPDAFAPSSCSCLLIREKRLIYIIQQC